MTTSTGCVSRGSGEITDKRGSPSKLPAGPHHGDHRDDGRDHRKPDAEPHPAPEQVDGMPLKIPVAERPGARHGASTTRKCSIHRPMSINACSHNGTVDRVRRLETTAAQHAMKTVLARLRRRSVVRTASALRSVVARSRATSRSIAARSSAESPSETWRSRRLATGLTLP